MFGLGLFFAVEELLDLLKESLKEPTQIELVLFY